VIVILVACGLLLMVTPGLIVGGIFLKFHRAVLHTYLPIVDRIFQEKPLFIVPRGLPDPAAQAVDFPAIDGKTLKGAYFKSLNKRRGVVLFGLEYGSDRWSCRPYVEHLLAAGYDVFSFAPRGQGESDPIEGYEPLQWVTQHEVDDTRAAIAYLRSRPDADPDGIGFFGISKGAGAGLVASATEPYVRCFVTDGVFGSETTTIPYMRQFFRIYNTTFPLEMIPDSYLRYIFHLAARRIEHHRRCRFADVESAMAQLAPRAILMIHGEGDTYIRPEMARALFERCSGPRELWVVPGARHNQALHVAEDSYRRRVLEFFDRYLADLPTGSSAAAKSESHASPDANRKEAVPSGSGV
jgi:pimeloyl-ACP methyl ester carboxylesterase